MNSIGLQISFNLPHKFDTTFISYYYSDYDCQNIKSYSFANSEYNSIYRDSSLFFEMLGRKIQLELLEISEELNSICAYKDYETFIEYVKQINALSNFDTSQYHQKIELIENANWSAVRLYRQSSINDVKFWEMQSYIYFQGIFFQIDMKDSKNELETIKSEVAEIFRNLEIKKIN